MPLLSYAQGVGIGTTAPATGAALEIKSSDKGLLIPRLTAGQRLAIATPPQGLMVYQTDGTAGGGTQTGFWYYAGTGGWVLVSASSTAWSLSGNAATDSTTNYLGTTDTKPLRLGTNGQEQARLHLNGAFWLGGGPIGAPSFPDNHLLLGYQAGKKLPASAYNNQFVGYQAGLNTTGDLNQFTGFQAGLSNIAGAQNYFSGMRSGFSNTSGSYNQFSGYQSGLHNTTGGYNQFCGFESGVENITGSFNTAFGYASGPTDDNLTNAAAFGFQAIVSQSNSLVLGGTGASAVRVGIGTTGPAASALLDLTTTTKGLLLPRLTAAQREAIASPAAGLVVFQTNGTPGIYYFNGRAWVNQTTGIVPDANGSTGSNLFVTTLAGMVGVNSNTDGQGTAAGFNQPSAIAVDGAGTVYIANSNASTIRKITPGGLVTTFAGAPLQAGSTDATGTAARFNIPAGICVDGAGTLYVADQQNHTIRKITAAGAVTTLAGSAGLAGSTDGIGAAARFNGPQGVALNAAGTLLYVADKNNNLIRQINISTRAVSLLAGAAGTTGSANGSGAAASFNNPTGVAVSAAGSIYVADYHNSAIRAITPAGAVTTLAGQAGSSGSADGQGAAARFFQPVGLCVGPTGLVYVADSWNSTIRQITPAGKVTTVAGLAGTDGSRDGAAEVARFNFPTGIATDAAGALYLADEQNLTVRVIK